MYGHTAIVNQDGELLRLHVFSPTANEIIVPDAIDGEVIEDDSEN